LWSNKKLIKEFPSKVWEVQGLNKFEKAAISWQDEAAAVD